MSFFNSIKRVFGFGEDDIEEEIGIDATVTPRSIINQETASQNGSAGSGADDCPEETEDEIPEVVQVNIDGIFEHVITVFNDSLPPFLKESVDVEAQRKYLYETLDKSVKEHLDQVRAAIAEQTEMIKHRELTRLRKQLHEAGEKAKRNEETSGEWKRQQLSAERQKRALAERIHDLENKINELHAEREQFELENKSLVNRLRVYSVQDEDVNSLREQIITLQEQLQKAGNGESATGTLPPGATVLSDKELEQMKIKQDMADAMINDLNRSTSELRQQLAAEQQRTTQLTLSLEQADKDKAADSSRIIGYENQISELNANIEHLTAELHDTQSELAQANENLSMMEEIRLQLEKLDDVMSKKNARIKELQTQNDALKKRNDSLTEELLSLKKTIESNLMSQARSESEMQQVIDDLRDELARATERSGLVSEPDSLDLPLMNEKGRRRSRKSQNPTHVKISAIDESLESTDWLVATPPAGTPTLPGMSNDGEFGYKEPAHKSPPENDAQMSLW